MIPFIVGYLTLGLILHELNTWRCQRWGDPMERDAAARQQALAAQGSRWIEVVVALQVALWPLWVVPLLYLWAIAGTVAAMRWIVERR